MNTLSIFILQRQKSTNFKKHFSNTNRLTLVFVLLLFIFLSFTALISSGDYTTDNDNSYGDYQLKKTVYNTARVLIVAGLEGTGHHAISAMLEICRKKKPLLCEVDKELSDKLMLWSQKQKQVVVHGLFGSADTSDSLKISLDIRSYLQNLAKKRTGNHLIYVGLGVTNENGMFSYPSFNGKFKSLDHPDVYQLAIIAEQAGIDLRILVLQRNAVSILASVERRHFGTKDGEEPKVLIDNAAAMYAQLSLLDRRFFFCLDYEQLALIKSSTLQRELARFLQEEEMPKILPEMIKAIRPSSSKPTFPATLLNNSVAIRHSKAKHNSSKEYLAFQLQARLTLIDRLCRTTGSSSSSSSSSRSSKEKPIQSNEEKESHDDEIMASDRTEESDTRMKKKRM